METKSERKYPDLSFARVLVVDDMPPNLVMASGLLKMYKIQTDGVKSGEEALALIKSGTPKYNAILMDKQMPGMDGIETVRQIRSLDSDYAKNIPVIAMTGEDSAESEELFLKNGFQAFIAKPLSVAKLFPIIMEWIHE